MSATPFNLPIVEGHYILAFSKYSTGASTGLSWYILKIHTNPTIAMRAKNLDGSSISSLELTDNDDGSQTWVEPAPRDTIPAMDDREHIPANAISYEINDGKSYVKIWCWLTKDNALHWYVVAEAGTENPPKYFYLAKSYTLTLTTFDVYSEDNELLLRGGTFSFPIRLVVLGRDLPWKVGDRCFWEYTVGDDVDTNLGITQTEAHFHDNYYDDHGQHFPESNIGGKIISPGGYESGLEARPFYAYDDATGEYYIAGTRIVGTAARPGLYLLHLWSRSSAINPSLGYDDPQTYFDGGENDEIIIISIREKKPMPGDLMLLVPNPIAGAPNEYLKCTHSDIDDITWSEHIEKAAWVYSPELWDDSRPGETEMSDEELEDFLTFLAEVLGGEDGDVTAEEIHSWVQGNKVCFPTGHIHHPGFWYLLHDQRGDTAHHYTWYVICRDKLNDVESETRGVWRLYAANDISPDRYVWQVVGERPEIGLINEYGESDGKPVATRIEVPPKCWLLNAVAATPASVNASALSSSAESVEENGNPDPSEIFDHYDDILKVEEVGEFAPDGTISVDGTSVPLYRENTDRNRVIYEHPELGWVLLDSPADTPTGENQLKTLPQTIHVGWNDPEPSPPPPIPPGTPRYIFFKGFEEYIVPDYGIFGHAGYMNIALPPSEDAAPDAPPQVVTVEVLQQEPCYNIPQPGWEDLQYYPPRTQHTDGKLLYRHPVLDWVIVDDLSESVSEDNKLEKLPKTFDYIAVPYAPPAPPMVVGGNPDALRRDLAVSCEQNIGYSVGNINADGNWDKRPLAMLGEMVVAGYFSGGIIWPNYPLQRMINFERLRLHVTASITVDLLGGVTGVDVSEGNELEFSSYAGGTPSHPAEPDGSPGSENWGNFKGYNEQHWSSSCNGKCAASLSLDLPCWDNGYLLFADVRGVAASTVGSEAVSFNTGQRLYWSLETNRYHYVYPDQYEWEHVPAGWYREAFNNTRDSGVIWSDCKSGSLAPDGCSVNVWLRCAVGHGRELGLCPPKMLGSDRPSDQIVFSGIMGVNATWHFQGSCKYQQTKVEEWEKKSVDVAGWDPGGGEWVDHSAETRPSDTPEEDSEVELSVSAGRTFTSGLQTWKLKNRSPEQVDDRNVLHGYFQGEYRSYRQGGASTHIDEITREFSSWGSCDYSGGYGTVSGRTTYDDIEPDTDIQYPIAYFGGNANCKINTHVAGDDMDKVYEYHYPPDGEDTPTAQGARDAYEEYEELVRNCDADYPAVATWRADGKPVDTFFVGFKSSDHRNEEIELTIEIQEI